MPEGVRDSTPAGFCSGAGGCEPQAASSRVTAEMLMSARMVVS
jgi:hypothetical protein